MRMQAADIDGVHTVLETHAYIHTEGQTHSRQRTHARGRVHTVVSMNMRRVTPVLIVDNDCSHGPSPRCRDAVPLSIVVAPPPVTLRCHCDR